MDSLCGDQWRRAINGNRHYRLHGLHLGVSHSKFALDTHWAPHGHQLSYTVPQPLSPPRPTLPCMPLLLKPSAQSHMMEYHRERARGCMDKEILNLKT